MTEIQPRRMLDDGGRVALHRFAFLTAGATFVLIIAGGLVTSTGSALSVPDWPLSYGQLMPPMVGGVRFEHGHRMVAGGVAILTLVLAVWAGLRETRRWVKMLAFTALGAILAQAVLGGVTVLFLLPTPISVAHACLGQTFFCLTVALALVTSPRWPRAGTGAASAESAQREKSGRSADDRAQPSSSGSAKVGESPSGRSVPFSPVAADTASAQHVRSGHRRVGHENGGTDRSSLGGQNLSETSQQAFLAENRSLEKAALRRGLSRLAIATFAAGYLQLVFGAIMRHTDAGLAIPDFPLSFGRLVPPSWSGPIAIHFAHRAWAAVVFVLGTTLAVRVLSRHSLRPDLARSAWLLLALLPGQIALGAATVLTRRLVVPTTAHVATGALILATSLVLAIRANRLLPGCVPLGARATATIADRHTGGREAMV